MSVQAEQSFAPILIIDQ